MEKKSYPERLKDPRWQKKRLEIFERDGWKCVHCLSEDDTLNVHHKCYRDINPWEYEDNELETLCSSCHEHERELKTEGISELLRVLKEKPIDAHDILKLAEYIEILDLRGALCALFEYSVRDKD